MFSALTCGIIQLYWGCGKVFITKYQELKDLYSFIVSSLTIVRVKEVGYQE